MNLRGLYAITPDTLCREPERLLAAVSAAITGGAVLVQYRDKCSPPARRLEMASALAKLCRDRNVKLIINDDPQLALDCGAAGVHLGRRDASLRAARDLLGIDAIIGITCGSDLVRAREARDAGANYVSFGAFFASRTKPEAPAADPGLLPAAREALDIPICAIGGLTPDNAGALVEAGAVLVAAAGGLFDADDVEARARAYSALFTTIPR